jgi:hypothetical protein
MAQINADVLMDVFANISRNELQKCELVCWIWWDLVRRDKGNRWLLEKDGFTIYDM